VRLMKKRSSDNTNEAAIHTQVPQFTSAQSVPKLSGSHGAHKILNNCGATAAAEKKRSISPHYPHHNVAQGIGVEILRRPYWCVLNLFH
jgi:hypothetical protein